MPIFRIMTNGVAFAVQHQVDDGWEFETQPHVSAGVHHVGDDETIEFKSYGKAYNWIREQYGERAEIKGRTWRET